MDADGRRRSGAELGPVIARGRDVAIHEAGPGRVLRRAVAGRDLGTEARVMAHAADAGYPTPAVHRVGDGEMEMDRLVGPTMLDDLGRRPWRLRSHAHTLAALHRRLGEIPPPTGLGLACLAGAGGVLCHGDLHPANVMITPAGPVVIDWSNALIGPAGFDAADAWLVLSAAEVEGSAVLRGGARLLRWRFRQLFLAGVDRGAARQALWFALDRRLADANMSPSEGTAMRELVAAELGR